MYKNAKTYRAKLSPKINFRCLDENSATLSTSSGKKKSMKRVSATQTGRLTQVRRLNAAKKRSIRHKYCTRRHGGGTIKQIKKSLTFYFSLEACAHCACAHIENEQNRTPPSRGDRASRLFTTVTRETETGIVWAFHHQISHPINAQWASKWAWRERSRLIGIERNDL